MFVEAIEKSTKFTKPLISSHAYADGTVDSGIGTYIMINRDGWAITAAHCINGIAKLKADKEKKDEIDRHNAEHPDDRKEYDPKMLLAHSMWFGDDRIRFETIHVTPEFDLAIMKLVNLPPDFVTDYPVFKSPENVKPGMSLCRTGFPFINVKSSFEPTNNRCKIDVPSNIYAMYFPNEAMLTRSLTVTVKTPNGALVNEVNGIPTLFIETSTPGLKGQSGGPIFDVKGNIVGMQSRTAFMDLNFGDCQQGAKYMPEQFMNLGIAVHSSTIMKVLDKFNVKYKSEADDDGYRIIG